MAFSFSPWRDPGGGATPVPGMVAGLAEGIVHWTGNARPWRYESPMRRRDRARGQTPWLLRRAGTGSGGFYPPFSTSRRRRIHDHRARGAKCACRGRVVNGGLSPPLPVEWSSIHSQPPFRPPLARLPPPARSPPPSARKVHTMGRLRVYGQ